MPMQKTIRNRCKKILTTTWAKGSPNVGKCTAAGQVFRPKKGTFASLNSAFF